MKVCVRKVNYKRGWVVFEKEDGDFGWFEILDTVDLEEDDLLKGDFDILGGTNVIKLATGENIDIFIEDYGMTYKRAIEMAFR
jgi:hypothetical protein